MDRHSYRCDDGGAIRHPLLAAYSDSELLRFCGKLGLTVEDNLLGSLHEAIVLRLLMGLHIRAT
jgi:hypothetical protein